MLRRAQDCGKVWVKPADVVIHTYYNKDHAFIEVDHPNWPIPCSADYARHLVINGHGEYTLSPEERAKQVKRGNV